MKTVLPRAALALALVSTGACGDAFLTEDPKHLLVPENLFTDRAGFDAGLNALYDQVRQERRGTDGGANDILAEIWWAGVDNGFANWRSTNVGLVLNDWGAFNNPDRPIYNEVWEWLYETVNVANTIIERAESPTVRWTAADKNTVVGEARVIRAWAYRHLTYTWGGVPLKLNESTGANVRTDWTRAPKEEVWKQMEQDLLFGEQHLPNTSRTGARVTKAVAQHYLAELYLAMGEPAKAEQRANAVVSSGDYRLITTRYGVRSSKPGTPFMDQFWDGNVRRDEGNTEVLWALLYEHNTPGGGGSIMRRYWLNRYWSIRGMQATEEYGGRGNGRLAQTRWALTLYGKTDHRGSNDAYRWFYLYNNPSNLPSGVRIGDTLRMNFSKEKVNDDRWPSIRKWEWALPQDLGASIDYMDQPYVRLAETYLLLAEAQLKQGKRAEAAENINIIRRRAQATPITAAEVTLDFILDERSRELAAEEHRRHTLVRTGTWLERTRRYNPLAGPKITERDRLFPIPQRVIDANVGAPLEQNPGY